MINKSLEPDSGPPKKILCIGHRGAAGHAPENTLLSIRKAIQLSADWIEIDVHAVHDKLLVIHDGTLNRTTSGKGSLNSKSLSEIRSFDAGHGERIPFISEVFEITGPSIGLHIELKGLHAALPAGRLIMEMIGKGWPGEQIIVSSFRHNQLRLLKQNYPSVQIGVLFRIPSIKSIQTAKKLNAVSIHLPWQLTRRKLIEKAHASGLSVLVYTLNQKSRIRDFMEMGVDGIFSDFPDRVIEMRKTFTADS
jgi:glycerophosphoryl diester phosphodiesterase